MALQCRNEIVKMSSYLMSMLILTSHLGSAVHWKSTKWESLQWALQRYSCIADQKRLGDPVYWVTYIIPSSSWGSETSQRKCLCQSLCFAVTERSPVVLWHCSKLALAWVFPCITPDSIFKLFIQIYTHVYTYIIVAHLFFWLQPPW